MASCQLKQFTKPSLLKTIDPVCLVELLAPHRSYFEERGLPIPDADSAELLDHERLILILGRPADGLPEELVDGLWLVDSMASTHAMDAMLDEIRRIGLPVRDLADPSPADLAIQIWLHQPDLLGRLNAEQNFAKRRSFRHYHGQVRTFEEVPRFVGRAQIAELEAEMDRVFVERKRGKGCRVLESPAAPKGQRWFFIRHGELVRRDRSLAKGKSSSVCYRPEAYDVVVYSAQERELRVNAKSLEWLYDLYRSAFGTFLFADSEHFAPACKYTLEPLKNLRSSDLVCSDVPEIEWITLKCVGYRSKGDDDDVMTWSSRRGDLLLNLERRKKRFPSWARIVQATFRVKLRGSKKARTMSIESSDLAKYTRDEEGAIFDRWLRLRGFILPNGRQDRPASSVRRQRLHDRRLLGSARDSSRSRALAS